MSSTFDLTWGSSKCVRDAFLDTYSGICSVFGVSELNDCNYPSHEGNEKLLELTKDVIFRQTGVKYRHILLTNGATGGVTIAMRAYSQAGHHVLCTRPAPFFTIYPSMIAAAGFTEHRQNLEVTPGSIFLIDSPSNPEGKFVRVGWDTFTIWDAVYHNNVYTDGKQKSIWHDVAVGSYSKLTGLNGIRVGWVATNNSIVYERMKSLVTAEYCGISHADSTILLNCLDGIEWDIFELNARYRLDSNRTEWSKLEKFFDGQPVNSVGMFYYGKIDKSAKKLMEKAGVKYMPGSSLGTSDDFARFNLGQENKILKDAVKAILRVDKS